MSHPKGNRRGLYHRLSRGTALTAVTYMATIVPAVAQTKPPNILLILIDDIGPEHLSEYAPLGEEPFADTEDFDEWAQTWARFEHAWATPLCSPTRVAIQTGLFGFRTGVGTLVPEDNIWGLDLATAPYTLARVLGNDTSEEELELPTAYTTVMFGKYHMGSSPGPDDDPPGDEDCEFPENDCVPDQGGSQSPGITADFDDYIVHQQDLQDDEARYTHYWISTPTVDSFEVVADTAEEYLTHATFEWFRDWCTDNDCTNQLDATTPWYAYIAPFAAHAPLHCPPSSLYPGQPACNAETPNKTKYYLMIRALGIEIDRTLSYLAGIGENDTPTDPDNTLIIVAGDNGSPGVLSEAPFNPARAKGMVAEGGVRVPLWIGGGAVTVSGEVDWTVEGHFVQLLDLFPTILTVAGGAPANFALDGVSLTPFFTDLDPDAVKDFAYVESFYPNFDPDPEVLEGPAVSQWAVRNATHKWVKKSTGETALFLLAETPLESNNLLVDLPLDQEDQDAYDDILEYYGTLGFGTLAHLGLCALEVVGAGCTEHDDCCSNMCVQASPPPPGDLTCQLPEAYDDD